MILIDDTSIKTEIEIPSFADYFDVKDCSFEIIDTYPSEVKTYLELNTQKKVIWFGPVETSTEFDVKFATILFQIKCGAAGDIPDIAEEEIKLVFT